ncbi:hypothetical protein T4B_9357 [Trichinella pseudospiralis]|uniref:Uncharacterized protein n=1 Tax=Trichinella pseudospiralis TaxID=6337 RepID=A0A0V1JQI5_TRIPS|nr:hypothetical protein T4B_9357 [Trichinella pseudospiralis]KRZ37204.1 hypothetical protein T4C_13407 [Trichinella pseudospiralis]
MIFWNGLQNSRKDAKLFSALAKYFFSSKFIGFTSRDSSLAKLISILPEKRCPAREQRSACGILLRNLVCCAWEISKLIISASSQSTIRRNSVLSSALVILPISERLHHSEDTEIIRKRNPWFNRTYSLT